MRFSLSVCVLLMLTLTQLAAADFTVTNDSNEKLKVIYGYFDPSQDAFRVKGYYHINPGRSQRLKVPAAVDPVFARIWTASEVVFHDRPSAWTWAVHPRRAFEVVYKHAERIVLQSNVPREELVSFDDFYEYANNTTFTYQPGNGSVNIPDRSLSAAIASALGKARNAKITPADMLRLQTLQVDTIDDAPILTGLEFATNLTWLSIRQKNISDISPLANLRNLTTLFLRSNNISDISPLAKLTNLTTLFLGYNNISDISPLANLRNLTSLDLRANNIPDISLLANFTKLTELSVGANTISDVSPLANLRNLTSLDIWMGNISDVSPLANLRNLTRLHLGNNTISDVSPLANLTNLTELFLSNNKISDFSPIAGLIPNLRHYSKDNQDVPAADGEGDGFLEDEGPMERDASAEDEGPMERDASAEDVGPMERDTSDGGEMEPPDDTGDGAETVVVGPNIPVNIPDPKLRADIEDELGKAPGAMITAADMLKLTWISGVDHHVENLTGLQFATNLTHLKLRSHNISDISPLAKLTNLTFLDLENNKIEDISALANLTSLTGLMLGGNNISNVSPLATLTNLISLYLSDNNISDVSPLATLTNLTGLSLSDNNISDVSPLATLTNLTSFSIDGNPTSDASVLAQLKAHTVNLDPPYYKAGDDEYRFLVTVRNAKGQPVAGARIDYSIGSSSGQTSPTGDKGQTRFEVRDISDEDPDELTELSLTVTDRTGHTLKKVIPLFALKRSYNQYGAKVYKRSDGHETVLVKGLTLEGRAYPYQKTILSLSADDLTQYIPPRVGRHFRIYGQGKTNNCGQTAARMVLSYYGVDVGLKTFNDVADIHTTVFGSTPVEMMRGLELLPVDRETYSGTSANYPRDESLRDKISASRPPILVTRTGKNAYHHSVVLGYDTKTDQFLIANPSGEGRFYWISWGTLNSLWRLDYQAGKTWAEFWDKINKANAWGQAPFVPDIKFALLWSDQLAPYRMYVPKEAPPYHHLASETHEIYVTGNVEWNPFKWTWHDWEVEKTFNGKVIYATGVSEDRDGDVRDIRIEGNKVIVSGRISNGVPLDANIFGVDEVFYGAIDMVLTVYYNPSVAAAPTIVLPAPPMATTLLPNYPNPFNPETWIPYHLSEPARVTLTIYAVDGGVVRHLDLGHQAAGYYQSKARAAYWDGRNARGERVASGIYFYTLKAGDFSATQKMLIRK